jgi:hypothetical protein
MFLFMLTKCDSLSVCGLFTLKVQSIWIFTFFYGNLCGGPNIHDKGTDRAKLPGMLPNLMD